jgi:hypothetical protein
MGALTTSYLAVTPQTVAELDTKPAHSMLKYRSTPFGVAILRYIGDKMGVLSPKVRSLLEQLLGEKEK